MGWYQRLSRGEKIAVDVAQVEYATNLLGSYGTRCPRREIRQMIACGLLAFRFQKRGYVRVCRLVPVEPGARAIVPRGHTPIDRR